MWYVTCDARKLDVWEVAPRLPPPLPLPHILSKVDRVGFGLLNLEDAARLRAVEGPLSKSRKLLAVPFVGKDVPSRQSEWSHPDIRIGLTGRNPSACREFLVAVAASVS